MKENDEDVVHAGIESKSQKIPEFRPILEFATDTLFWTTADPEAKLGDFQRYFNGNRTHAGIGRSITGTRG